MLRDVLRCSPDVRLLPTRGVIPLNLALEACCRIPFASAGRGVLAAVLRHEDVAAPAEIEARLRHSFDVADVV